MSGDNGESTTISKDNDLRIALLHARNSGSINAADTAFKDFKLKSAQHDASKTTSKLRELLNNHYSNRQQGVSSDLLAPAVIFL